MTTTYQQAVARDIRTETAARRKAHVAQYGPRFVDVVIEAPDKHGRGRVGYTCMFSGHQTAISGQGVAEFARRAFKGGRLRKVVREWHTGEMVTTYVVLA